MSRIDEILNKQKALAEELERAKLEERDVVLEELREKIRLFGFKTTDFKGVLATRRRRSKANITSKRGAE